MSQSVGVGTRPAVPAELSFLGPTCTSHRDKQAGPGWPEELANVTYPQGYLPISQDTEAQELLETPSTQDGGGPRIQPLND